MRADITALHLPRWQEIPDVGLYLEQTVKYINTRLAPLGCVEVTASMVSNYVKKGLIERPAKKQYSAAQLAGLLVIAIVKSCLSMENIAVMLQEYRSPATYDLFCARLEAVLTALFGAAPTEVPSPDTGDALLDSVITTAAHAVYLSDRFGEKAEQAQAAAQ